MLTVKSLTELSADNYIQKPCVLLVGGFDGLHVGHETLFSYAKMMQMPVGVMSITGGKGQPLFTCLEREEAFQKAGVDFCFFLDFEEIKDTSAEEFCDFLTKNFCVSAFVCGEDFKFGKNALGTPSLLKERTGIKTEILPLLKIKGKKVGTRDVKRAIDERNIPLANEYLQGKFFVKGVVERDRGVGKTLGFPTANVLYPENKYPLPYGVYQTEVEIGGKTYRGITNYGARPTFDNEKIVTETYVDGFSGDLYGKTLSIRFVRFLRETSAFKDVEALKTQLKKDIERVRNYD